MQYKVCKIAIFFLIFLSYNSIKAQVFGGCFYINFNREKYNINAYGIDNDKFENNKTIILTSKEIRNVKYDLINFISFQDTTGVRKNQFYETIILKLTSKKKKDKEMLILITGRFWDILNYRLDIEFKEGVYSIFIPVSEEEQLKLKRTDIVRGGTVITDLLIKIKKE